MSFKAKYDMTRDENIAYAKRNIVDYIYESAKLEGLAVTFPDTQDIYNGITLKGGSVRDVITINNLKHSWEFIFDTIDIPMSYAYICKLNQFVGDGQLIHDAGFLRTLDVRMGGTDWRPEIPMESVVKEELEELFRIPLPMERALRTTLYLMRRQLFFDGNKRTAMLVGNKILIENGLGIFSVHPGKQNEFSHMLIHFYETNDYSEIISFLYSNCIDGTDFR